jgi:ABC-type antimicrobial peptide transport system permease subunit
VPPVMGHYFQAQGIPIIRGRDFTDADDASAPLVVIVNHALAEHYWRGQEPIGKRLHRGPKEGKLPWLTVVGEITDLKDSAADAPALDQFYIPDKQSKADTGSFAPPDMLVGNNASIVMRAALAPEQMIDSLRAVVRAIDPQLPLTDIESMDRVVREGQAPRRFNTVLISSFAAAAVLLSVLGIYSVIAFSAAMRTQEMAIRLALGSQRSSLMQLVLLSGAKLGLVGCGLGAIASVFATRLLHSMLFQVDSLNPAVMGLAAISIFLLALAASIVPAVRAARIHPIEVLRAG